MTLKAKHLNTNMWISGVRENFKNSTYWTLGFFMENKIEKILEKSDISEALKPILKTWWDILSFSEVCWQKQLEITKELLEQQHYKTYSTEAFDMWNMKGEKLYNVIWIKDGNFDLEEIKTTKLYNKRKKEALLISFYNFLRTIPTSTEKFENLDKNIKLNMEIFSRLANWVLDGAISSVKIDDFILTTLHVHSDNPLINETFRKHYFSKEAHVIMWDFNMKDSKYFLENNGFEGYKSFLEEKDKTYSYAKGFSHLPLFQQPDNAFYNDKIENKSWWTFASTSDHNWIEIEFSVK